MVWPSSFALPVLGALLLAARPVAAAPIATYSFTSDNVPIQCGGITCYKTLVKLTTIDDVAGFMVQLSGTTLYDPPFGPGHADLGHKNEVFNDFQVTVRKATGTNPATVSAYSLGASYVPAQSTAKHVATIYTSNPQTIVLDWSCEQGCANHASRCWAGVKQCVNTL
jgi:hypothetical protein